MSGSKDPRDDVNYRKAPADVEDALRAAERIEDTLPPPEELVRKKRSITIRLDADVVEWFREQGGQYQTMINEVLRRYRDHFRGKSAVQKEDQP